MVKRGSWFRRSSYNEAFSLYVGASDAHSLVLFYGDFYCIDNNLAVVGGPAEFALARQVSPGTAQQVQASPDPLPLLLVPGLGDPLQSTLANGHRGIICVYILGNYLHHQDVVY